ncbi:MAG: hypothetical protein EA408_07565 [Marinilabiliales bacterium]|nr:MAG: hypothetical protein EA408_07565 [Marinilabiliales bacterium]
MSEKGYITSEKISIRELAKTSESPLLQRMPGVVFKLIEKIIMQDEINRIIDEYRDYKGVDFLPVMLEDINIRPVIKGIENLPGNGRCFFVANHPYGVADGLLITWLVSSRYGDLRAIGNDVFMLIPQLRPLIAAVDVFGRSSYREYIRELDKVYKSDIPITHFPAGLVSRYTNFRVQDSMWHKSFITKAIECKRDIVPLYFPGRNSFIFYLISFLRNLFFIKVNLELSLLPREFFNKRNKSLEVIIRKPISWKIFDKSKTPQEWAGWVREQTYKPDYY